MKPSFSLFGIQLYPYTLLMIAGAGLALGLFTVLTFRRRHCREENIFALEMLIVAMGAGVPFAMLTDSILKYFETGTFRLQGATFYGGLLGGIALWCPLLCIKRTRTVSVYERLNDLAPCIPAGHCLGRIGCFLGGCCFGAPTESALGVVFPPGSAPYEFYGGEVKIHPTQLYEAVALLVIFGIVLLCGKREGFPLYLILYGIARSVIECFRADDRGILPFVSLSPAQAISVLLIGLGVILFAVRIIKRRGGGKDLPRTHLCRGAEKKETTGTNTFGGGSQTKDG